jgi:signal transduction histidine kinase
MGRRTDGAVFFFVDSEPVGSEDESPAGQIYKEVSAEILRAFDTQTEIAEGPYSDRWGEWVSALVPLTDPKNGKLVALLGIDIDACSWKWEVAAKVGLPVGLALMLMGLSFLIIILAQSRRQILVQRERLQERTEQLQEVQDELVRQEKLAMLGQVAGSVGHELRNPLGVMNNAVYFLQTVLAGGDESVKEYLGIIMAEITRSEHIVDELLSAVRTRSPDLATHGVAELIGQTLRQCPIPASVAVTLDIPETISPFRVDAQQMQQVLRNLISNGVEAMPEGGTLLIRAVENRQEGTVIVSVRDSGYGMTPEVMAKLFQPLFTTKARGIGLGLVVAKNLIEVNGGRVEVQSEAGKGSVFSVILPADQ